MLDFTTFIEERSRNFTGRSWLFERIDGWLASGSRTFLIIGEPGSGKTAISARLFGYSTGSIEAPAGAKRIRPNLLSAVHFCSGRDAGWTDPLHFVKSISHQLAQRFPDFSAALLKELGAKIVGTATAETNLGQLVGVYIANLTVTGTTKPSSVFVSLVRSPLEAMFARDPKAGVIILVDGLDEAEAAANQGDSIASLIAQTGDFPTGFRFIVTTRSVPVIERSLRRLGSQDAEVTLSKGTDETLSKLDVASYIAASLDDHAERGNAAALKVIAERAGANFLYAKFAIRILNETPAEETEVLLSRLPPGLEELYLEYLDRLPDVKVRWSKLYRPILGTLKVAQESLTLTQLTALAASTPPLEETSVLDGVTALSQFLDVEGTPRSYRLYHQSFADFLEGESAGQYQSRASLFHATITQAYGVKPLDAYAWRWLSYHLAKAGRTDYLRSLLLDVTYIQGKLNATDPNALISDYDYLPTDATLSLIQGAMRLSASVIARDPRQFASQLVGRLLSYVSIAEVRRFNEALMAVAPRPWLRPLKPSLYSPKTGLLRTIESQGKPLYAVAVTPDDIVVSAGELIQAWDVNSGRNLNIIKNSRGRVNAVAATAEGHRIVSASSDGMLRVWDIESGYQLQTVRGNAVIGSALAVTPDGGSVIFAANDHSLRVWELESNRVMNAFHGHVNWISAVAVTSDGHRIISASHDKTLRVWDIKTGVALMVLEGHKDRVSAVAVTLDGRRVVSGSYDNTLIVWDTESGCVLKILAGHEDRISSVAVTSRNRRVVSASFDKTLKLWDLENDRELRTLKGHDDRVSAIAVTSNDRRAVSASYDGTIKVWDIGDDSTGQLPEDHADTVSALAATPNRQKVISASYDNTLKVWDVKNREELLTLRGHTSAVLSVAIISGNRLAISGSADNTLRVWALDGGYALRTLQGHRGWVSAVAVTPDGLRAISGSADKTIKVWNLENGNELRTLRGHANWVNVVTVAPDGRRAVSGSADSTLKVWDLDSARELQVLTGHTSSVTALALTPDAQHAISGSSDGVLKVWDIQSGYTMRTLQGHKGAVNAVAVSPDGRRLISASADKSLKLWELESGVMINEFSCDASAMCCTFVGDNIIVVGDRGHRLHFLIEED